ncbi:hypothetical protein [Oceanithermus sp.]
MTNIQRLFRAPKAALPAEMLNLLIEVDNREGLRGLDRLEAEIRYAERRLRRSGHPQAARLNLWLRALSAYREAYYPRRSFLKRLFRRRTAHSAALPSRQLAG